MLAIGLPTYEGTGGEKAQLSLTDEHLLGRSLPARSPQLSHRGAPPRKEPPSKAGTAEKSSVFLSFSASDESPGGGGAAAAAGLPAEPHRSISYEGPGENSIIPNGIMPAIGLPTY